MNYTERFAFVENQSYSKQVSVALWIAAAALRLKPNPTPEELAWATKTLRGPADTDMQRLVMIRVVAMLGNQPPAPGVTDTLIQESVDALVPDLVAAG